MANWQYDSAWGVWVDMDADGVVTSKVHPSNTDCDPRYDYDHTETYDDGY